MGASRLRPCPDRPNCVSSQSTDPSHRVAPLPCRGTCEATLRQLDKWLRATPGVRVVESEPSFLRAEFTTAIFRFVDDLELLIDPGQGVIHVRSASRVGSWDFGTNRRRVEALRRRLVDWQDRG